MTTCGSCGRHVDGHFPFCPYCRAEMTPAPTSREERKRVTILFCDITGSTALGEATDPEALRALLARYFEGMKGIIESHGGTVEKFIGDAVMAVFGVPVLHEDDALRAIRAADEMQAALPQLGVRARIGISSGEVVTGTSERLATGDAVNVAARLEQAAAPSEVLLGEGTVQLVRDMVEVVAVPPLELKGKAAPVPAYRLIRVKETDARRKLLTPMIGREHELRRLQDAYAQMEHDRSCQLFTVLGAAGVGKSRLASEFLAGVDRARVVQGRCLSYGQGITYLPIIEVLKQLDALPSDAYAASALESLLGQAQTVASAEEIGWGFRKLLDEQAMEQSLVMVFDDIHWGEESFLDLIEHVADLSRDAPILLLCMARPELLEKRSNWGGGKWNATTLLLEPLDEAETDQLLDALGGVEEGLRERIRVAAEGNPLFVEEMLALIKDSGGGAVAVPPTIQALLAARLDQLEPVERGVLGCGAVEGRVFHRSALTTLLDGEANLAGHLIALVRKELVRPQRAQLGGDEAYRFRHLLIRDAAYEALPKAVRAELHERLVQWLEGRGVERAELDEILGYHLEQAARYKKELGQADRALEERAGERLASAGRRALQRGDLLAATDLLERALALLRPIRLDVYLELDLINLKPTREETPALAEELAERAAATHDRRREAVARMESATFRLELGSGSVDEREALARAALPLLEEANDQHGLLSVWLNLSGVATFRGQFEQGARAAEQALDYARYVGRRDLFYQLAFPLVLGPRPADEALVTLEPLLVDEPHPGHRLAYAELLAMLSRFEEAQTIAREAAQHLLELAAGEFGADTLATIATLAGDLESAARYGRVFCDFLEERGWWSALSSAAPTLGRSLCLLGRYDEAETLAERGRELGGEWDVITQVLWRQVQALVLASRGEHEEAERLARQAVELAELTDALNLQGDAFCDLAEVLQRAGRPKDARTILEQAEERYKRKKNLAMVAQVEQRLGTENATATV